MSTVIQPIDFSKMCMVDIETLAISPKATILSIGACSVDDFSWKFDLIPLHEQGREVDPSTVQWWKTQEDKYPVATPLSPTLEIALTRFARFYIEQDFETIWCKGTDFDISILTDAYKQYNIPVPWKYSAVRDMRTLLKVWEEVTGNKASEYFGKNPNAHDALADALFQARQLQEVYKWLSR